MCNLTDRRQIPLLRAADQSLVTERHKNCLPSIGRWKINSYLSRSELDCVSYTNLLRMGIIWTNPLAFAFVNFICIWRNVKKLCIIFICIFYLHFTERPTKKNLDWWNLNKFHSRKQKIRHYCGSQLTRVTSLLQIWYADTT